MSYNGKTDDLVADLESGAPLSPGQKIAIEFDAAGARLFDPETGLLLR